VMLLLWWLESEQKAVSLVSAFAVCVARGRWKVTENGFIPHSYDFDEEHMLVPLAVHMIWLSSHCHDLKAVISNYDY